MTFMRTVATTTFALMVGGCITYSNLERNSSMSAIGDDAVIVMGVEPRFRVQVTKGAIENDQLVASPSAPVTLNIYPEDGYIVAKVSERKDGDAYYVAGILPEGVGLRPPYMPCDGNKTGVFEAVSGKVLYVGDVSFAHQEGRIGVRYGSDFDAARTFMAKHYASLAPSLVQADMRVLPVTNYNCSPQTMTIPVFVNISR